MAFLQTSLIEKHLHIITQLGTSYDTVITEKNSLAFEHRLVRYQFHLSYQRAHTLVAWSKRTRPCRRIFSNTTLIRHTLTRSITHSHTRTRIRNTTTAIHLHIISLGEIATIGKAHIFHITSLVGRSWETIINPQERTDLHLLIGRSQLFKTISSHLHNLSRTHLILSLIVEIRERSGFAGSSMGTILLADNKWRASPTVTGTDDTILGENHHGTRALDVMIHILDTLFESLALNDEQGYKFGRIGTAGRHLSKVHVLLQQMLGKFILVGNLCHCTDGKSAKMRVHDERLCIRIADDSNTRSSPFKLI